MAVRLAEGAVARHGDHVSRDAPDALSETQRETTSVTGIRYFCGRSNFSLPTRLVGPAQKHISEMSLGQSKKESVKTPN